MTKRDFVHRRRRLYPPSSGSGGGGEENDDYFADVCNSLTGSQGGHFVERRTTVRRRVNNDDHTNNVAGAKIRRKSTSSTSSTSYHRRTTNAASISAAIITSDSCAKGKQQTTTHGSKATQQHPTSPMKNIPIRFAQAWNPSKLFLESSKIILDFLLYQQGILPCIMQEFEATTFDGTTPTDADDRGTIGRSYRQRHHHHHQKHRSSSSSHSILLLQARKEIFSVWNNLIGSIATTIDHTPIFQQQELVISISFSFGGGSGSRNMDTCYLLSLKLPPPSQEEAHNSNSSNEGIRLHVVQPSPPQDRLARKLLTSILSSHSSSSQNESKSNCGSHAPPPPPSKKQHLVQQKHTNAMVHVWMENSSLEYLWKKSNHDDENNIGTLRNEEENTPARNSTLKQRQLPLKPDKTFSKKLRRAMLQPQHQQQQRPRRQNVQIYNVHLQLPFNNSVKKIKETPIASNFNETSASSSAFAATFDDNHGVWMQVGRPLKRIEP